VTSEEAAPILVVEDEPNIARLLRAYLEDAGYAVAHAGNGHDALALAGQHHPRLVLLDLMLPGLSGMRVCELLRRESDVPIVMLTARAQDAEKVAGLESGADDYIRKPFTHARLSRGVCPAPAPVHRTLRWWTRRSWHGGLTERLAGLGGGAVAVAFEQPVLVEVAGEAADRRAQLLKRVEALDSQHLF
jgi:CheY-like chemotaxis protein